METESQSTIDRASSNRRDGLVVKDSLQSPTAEGQIDLGRKKKTPFETKIDRTFVVFDTYIHNQAKNKKAGLSTQEARNMLRYDLMPGLRGKNFDEDELAGMQGKDFFETRKVIKIPIDISGDAEFKLVVFKNTENGKAQFGLEPINDAARSLQTN